MTVDCKSDGRREMVESFDKFSRDKKSKKNAMAHKNKTQKYPVNTTCQNVLCLLRPLKPRLEKDAISAGRK